MYNGATHAATPTPMPMRKRQPICRPGPCEHGFRNYAGTRRLEKTYHGPNSVGDGLSDGTANEDDVRNPHYRSPADKVTQHARGESSEERTEGSGRGDEFLRAYKKTVEDIELQRTHLLAGRELRGTQVPSDCYQRPGDHTGVITCTRY